ncbi:Vesicle membrane receptor protein (v-SNARE) [Basidiobolus ranarum]|uniref:Vesicle membrane receptor protein (V-SNARE) n=1 Tax=Basidiobolus ranarum TaxID=34480 RepID=A0ABR2WCS9_9FUNG
MNSGHQYDPTSTSIPTYNNNTVRQPENERTKMVQKQVDEVVNIMQDNINNVMDRGEKLESLNHKADDLEMGSRQFKRSAHGVRKKMWWKNMKMRLAVIALLIIILICIIVPIVVKVKRSNHSSSSAPVPTPSPTP